MAQLCAEIGVPHAALKVEVAPGNLQSQAREVLERAAVADLDADPEIEAFNLINAAVRRELGRRLRINDNDEIRADSEARKQLEQFVNGSSPQIAAESLLGWLRRRTEERGDIERSEH